MKPVVAHATAKDLREIVKLVGEFRKEILQALGHDRFRFDPSATAAERAEFLENSDYFILIARSPRGHPLGHLTLFEQRTQYEGNFGVLAELYVRPEFRRRGVANALLAEARAIARSSRWNRIEVPLPPTDRIEAALAFLDSKRFTEAGKRKRRQWL